MVKKINKFIYSSIVISILMFIMGLIFIVYPDISFTTVTYILSVLLIINGIYFIATKEESIFFSSFLTIGVIDILLGLVMILNPDIVKTLFPIVVGIVMIVKSVLDLRISLLLYRNEYTHSGGTSRNRRDDRNGSDQRTDPDCSRNEVKHDTG